MMTRLAVASTRLALVASPVPSQDHETRDPWGVRTPFWASDTMTNETLFLVSDGEQAASAPLLFRAEKVLRVQNANLEVQYVTPWERTPQPRGSPAPRHPPPERDRRP